MDTTDEYIEMCRQLPEDIHSDIIDGDFYYQKLASQERGGIYISYTEIFEDYIVHHPEQWDFLNGREIVKLYRQDQLQDMIKMDFPYVCWEFYHSIAIGGNTQRFHSYEQLWLVFVMQKMYKKRWNGSKWDEI